MHQRNCVLRMTCNGQNVCRGWTCVSRVWDTLVFSDFYSASCWTYTFSIQLSDGLGCPRLLRRVHNMNVIRHSLKTCLRRTYASASTSSTSFVPPASLRDLEREPRRTKRDLKVIPGSPTFYTARASYYDQVIQLETALTHSRHALTSLQLLPLPAFARQKLSPRQPVWKPKEDMTSVFNSRLTTSRYRRVTTLLNQLNDYQRIASTAGCYELGIGISEILQMFERENKEAVLARGKRKPVQFDQYGRTYTVGKRKTSAARVWIIPVQQKESEETPLQVEEKPPSDAELAGALLGLESTETTTVTPERPVTVSSTTILINNLPLAEYFPIPADRERILRPLKLAGVLGAYNVFALVRGGGTSGQSGAVAHGLAKGLAAHEPEIEVILRKGTVPYSGYFGANIILYSKIIEKRSTDGGAEKDRLGQGTQEGESI